MNFQNLKVEKIENKTVLNGKPLQILEFTHKDKTMITRKELKAICEKYHEKLKSKYNDGLISVSIEYPSRWFSADTSRLNEDINYMNLSDYEEFETALTQKNIKLFGLCL